MNAHEVAVSILPAGFDERMVERIVWGHTGFPAFWRIPDDGDAPEQCFRHQLQVVRAWWDVHGELPPSCLDSPAAQEVLATAARELVTRPRASMG